MAWWKQLFKRSAASSLDGLEYRVAFTLYSKDEQREVEVRELRNGQAYLVERECGAGTVFKDRHDGRMVGPFASPEDAERFIVTTAWFRVGSDGSQSIE